MSVFLLYYILFGEPVVMILVLMELAVGRRQACDCRRRCSNGFGYKLEEVPDDE